MAANRVALLLRPHRAAEPSLSDEWRYCQYIKRSRLRPLATVRQKPLEKFLEFLAISRAFKYLKVYNAILGVCREDLVPLATV
jgi:hypothetical protein